MRGYDRWHWYEDERSPRPAKTSTQIVLEQAAAKPFKDAMVNIAYDCASLADAQKLAREALAADANTTAANAARED